jgi:hypothetical protein
MYNRDGLKMKKKMKTELAPEVATHSGRYWQVRIFLWTLDPCEPESVKLSHHSSKSGQLRSHYLSRRRKEGGCPNKETGAKAKRASRKLN